MAVAVNRASVVRVIINKPSLCRGFRSSSAAHETAFRNPPDVGVLLGLNRAAERLYGGVVLRKEILHGAATIALGKL
jgi:hypothetical protein